MGMLHIPASSKVVSGWTQGAANQAVAMEGTQLVLGGLWPYRRLAVPKDFSQHSTMLNAVEAGLHLAP